jgi:mRNA-degrading endonuclease RelE of RelBE toxin-antitoxin system
MLNLFITNRFKKDWTKIPGQIKQQANGCVAVLRNDPLAKELNIKKLAAVKDKVWRLRIGVYRLIYSFDKLSLYLLRISHRKDIYRNL